VRGHVQGVGFRFFVSRLAARLGLAGWVANQPDGSVQVVAEGLAPALEELADALHRGPPGADVSAVEARRSAAQGEAAPFRVRSGHHRGD
jgi:acylphosphatase